MGEEIENKTLIKLKQNDKTTQYFIAKNTNKLLQKWVQASTAITAT